jgi:hypothetical protein
VATEELPLSHPLRLSLFQVTVGMALVLMIGTPNRLMIVELKVPATMVGAMLALPLVFAPFRALIGFRSDNFSSALGCFVVSAELLSVQVLTGATLAAGFGSGLFGHGTLTATMRSAPREQIGLSLGAWGAMQATAAGVSFSLGGIMRDAVLATQAAGPITTDPYIPVFVLESRADGSGAAGRGPAVGAHAAQRRCRTRARIRDGRTCPLTNFTPP